MRLSSLVSAEHLGQASDSKDTNETSAKASCSSASIESTFDGGGFNGRLLHKRSDSLGVLGGVPSHTLLDAPMEHGR